MIVLGPFINGRRRQKKSVFMYVNTQMLTTHLAGPARLCSVQTQTPHPRLCAFSSITTHLSTSFGQERAGNHNQPSNIYLTGLMRMHQDNIITYNGWCLSKRSKTPYIKIEASS